MRRWLARRGVEAVIPQRSDEIARDGEFGMDWAPYRRRSVVEQSVGWLEECRRVDKLAGSFLPFVEMAIIQRYLRILDPSDRA